MIFSLGIYPLYTGAAINSHLHNPWIQLAELHDERYYQMLLELQHRHIEHNPLPLRYAHMVNWLKSHPNMLYHFLWEVKTDKYRSHIYVQFNELADAILFKLSNVGVLED